MFLVNKIKPLGIFLLYLFLYWCAVGYVSNLYDSIILWSSNLRSLRTCHDSSKIEFYAIANLHQSDLPAAYLISTGTNLFSKGSLCLGVVVFIPNARNMSQGLAIENYPPDSIYLDLIGKDFQTVPNTEADFVQIQVNHSIARYYKFNIDFRDADEYYVSGYLEYINYLWNFEAAEDVFWNPFPLRILEFADLKEYKIVDKLKISVKGNNITPKSFAMLPLCKNGNARGRWVRSSLIKSKRDQSLSFKDWSINQNPEGKIWVPYDCRYRQFSYSEFSTCQSKSNAHLHFYGDSNIRRALKAITTGGAWCNTLYDPTSWSCQCADQGVDPIPYLNDNDDESYFGHVAGTKGFSIFYKKVRGFYDIRGDFDQILNISHVNETLSKLGKEFQKPTAVVFNLVNWDAGFFSWNDFKLNILKIVKAMKTTYNGVPLIFRTGQYFSGHVDPSKGHGLPRRYSRLRVKAFNQYAIRIFQKQLKDQIFIWDIASMGEAFSPQLKKRISKCVSNHMFRTGIDLENQLLFNILCPETQR